MIVLLYFIIDIIFGRARTRATTHPIADYSNRSYQFHILNYVQIVQYQISMLL